MCALSAGLHESIVSETNSGWLVQEKTMLTTLYNV